MSLFRVLKERNRRIYCCSSIGGHRTYIHCMRIAKAVLMWCMECICILSYMRISYRVGVCMCGEGFYFHFSLSPSKERTECFVCTILSSRTIHPLFGPTYCSHTTMADHVHSYHEYALDYEWVCVYVWEPASVRQCMYGEEYIRGSFDLSSRFSKQE